MWSENLKVIGLFIFFDCILLTNPALYDVLYSLDFYGWILCAIGYGVNVHSKVTQPIYGILHHPEGPLHWLLRATVSIFFALIINSDFDVAWQVVCLLFAVFCLFVTVTVKHHDHGGREVMVDIF